LFGGIGLVVIAVVAYVIIFAIDPEPQLAIAMRAAAAYL
jgi:zinc transporter ZupT